MELREPAKPLADIPIKPLDPDHPAARIFSQALQLPSKSEPLTISEPVQEITPVEIQTPSEITPAPLQTEPVIKSEPLQNISGVTLLPENAAHLRFPYEVFDKILRQFEPGPRVVLEELYRLSAGWDSDECTISIGKLCARCNIKPATIRLHLKKLQERGYISRLDDIVGGAVYEGRGIRFRVHLPRLTPSKKQTPPENVTPSKSEPNKLKALKENTHTQVAPPEAAGVSVGSRFSLKQCIAYAEHRKSSDPNMRSAGAVGRKLYETGREDELIAEWLAAKVEPQLDISQCPDCHGTGMYYPEGVGKGGVKKCDHKRLKEAGSFGDDK
jgi:DNA-binding transcriptional ArsR family regulator